MKRIFCLLIALFSALSLYSCSYISPKATVERGDALMQKKDYEGALVYYKEAVKDGDGNTKAKALCDIINAYISAQTLYNNGDYEGALEKIDSLKYDYGSYAIKSDMEDLVTKISSKLSVQRKTDKKLKQLEDFINAGDYEAAKETAAIIEELDLTVSQAKELDILTDELSIKSKAAEKKENTSVQSSQSDKAQQRPQSNEVQQNSQPDKVQPSSPNKNGSSAATSTSVLYHVRKSAGDSSSQIGAFASYDNAVKAAKENPGYYVYDENWNVVYPK
ncbi:MAG: hypothetical protein Q8873_05875 [Bacillota bacterium]|nr:hypothetical protein [Bacillota bacterium]